MTIQPCAGLVVAFASVWSEDCGQNELVRVDERSGRELARIPVLPADSEGLVTATQTAVYVVSKDASSVHYFVAKIEATTNKIVRKIPVAPGAVAAAACFGSVWITNPFLGTVTRIDAASDRVTRTTKTQQGARFLATGEGAVWILNQSDGSVSKLDPGSGNVVATIPAKVPGEGGCIATGLGSVWVTMPQLRCCESTRNRPKSSNGGPAGAETASVSVSARSGSQTTPSATSGESSPSRETEAHNLATAHAIAAGPIESRSGTFTRKRVP